MDFNSWLSPLFVLWGVVSVVDGVRKLRRARGDAPAGESSAGLRPTLQPVFYGLGFALFGCALFRPLGESLRMVAGVLALASWAVLVVLELRRRRFEHDGRH